MIVTIDGVDNITENEERDIEFYELSTPEGILTISSTNLFNHGENDIRITHSINNYSYTSPPNPFERNFVLVMIDPCKGYNDGYSVTPTEL